MIAETSTKQTKHKFNYYDSANMSGPRSPILAYFNTLLVITVLNAHSVIMSLSF